jgi:hypothetical protein
MRMVGEGKLCASIMSPGETRVAKQKMQKAARQKIAVVCTACQKEKLVKTGVLYKYFRDKEYRCYDCSMAKKAQDKKEMNQALINLARSKGLIK